MLKKCFYCNKEEEIVGTYPSYQNREEPICETCLGRFKEFKKIVEDYVKLPQEEKDNIFESIQKLKKATWKREREKRKNVVKKVNVKPKVMNVIDEYKATKRVNKFFDSEKERIEKVEKKYGIKRK